MATSLPNTAAASAVLSTNLSDRSARSKISVSLPPCAHGTSPPQAAVIHIPATGDWLALPFLRYRVPLFILIALHTRQRFKPFLIDSQHDPGIAVSHLAHLVFRRGAQHLGHLGSISPSAMPPCWP